MLSKVSSSLVKGISASQIFQGNAVDGQVLTYDSGTSMWVASAVPSNYIVKPDSASAQQVLTYNGSTSAWVASAAPVSIGAVIDDNSISSGDVLYVLKAADANKILMCNNTAALTASVPSNTFNVGTEIVLVQNSGTVTLSAGNGVTINSNGNKYKTNGINAAALLIKTQTNTWLLGGNTAL